LISGSPPGAECVEILQRWTEDRGLRLVQIPAGEQRPVAPSGEVSACDLVTALGGDGTILKALHAAARTGTPVLSVACGSLAVLTTVPENELRAALDRFAAGDRPRTPRRPAACPAPSQDEIVDRPGNVCPAASGVHTKALVLLIEQSRGQVWLPPTARR
jgi:ATP-NAD kinase N-terminal domain